MEILTLSLDVTLEKARVHLKKNGWTKTENGWSGPGEFDSDAAKAYSVAAIPNTWVIDAKGRIAEAATGGGFDAEAAVDRLLVKK